MRKVLLCPSTFGNSLNWLDEQNSIFSLLRRLKSSGKLDSSLPDKSKISSVSASSKISGGKCVKLHDKLNRLAPLSLPALSCASVPSESVLTLKIG